MASPFDPAGPAGRRRGHAALKGQRLVAGAPAVGSWVWLDSLVGRPAARLTGVVPAPVPVSATGGAVVGVAGHREAAGAGVGS